MSTPVPSARQSPPVRAMASSAVLPENGCLERQLPEERFLSQEACAALAKRVIGMTKGGGHTQVVLDSSWTGNVRWARNRVSTCGDVRNDDLAIVREINGADPYPNVHLNMIDDAALEAAVRRAERILQFMPEQAGSLLEVEYTEQHLNPTIWSEPTYQLEAEARAEVARTLCAKAEQAGLLAAGYVQVGATGKAVMNSRGRAMYYPYTDAQYSVTVRDPQGTGSGWAGLSHWDWGKIDAHTVTQKAIEKCLASRNPVALEPGRYTTILEPQAAFQMIGWIFGNGGLDRESYEKRFPPFGIFQKASLLSKIGDVVMDERITVEMDPMDPDLAHVPFAYNQQWLEVYHPVRWINRGVLEQLSYHQDYALQKLNKSTGLPTIGAFRLRSEVPPVSFEEMIATTPRGIQVTHFDQFVYGQGYTRDGLWLIENGKVSKPIKNFRVQEDGYLLLQPSRLEQIGAPERVFSPGVPVLVPPLKVKDFNFTQLADAI